MATITVRLSDEDKRVIEQMAQINGKNISEYVRDSLFEQIEDQYDYSVASKAYEAYLSDGIEYDLDEVIEEISSGL